MPESLGITVQFRADTTDFEKGVKDINAGLKQTKSEISLVNKELRLDPKNVENLTKKFDLLKQKEQQLAQLTETLKNGLKNVDPNSKEWDSYNKQLQKATVELNSIRKELQTMPTPKLDATIKSFEEFGGKLEKIGGSLEKIGSKLSILSGGVVGLATAGVKFNASMEQTQTAFATLVGDEERAAQLIKEIQGDASVSPFSTEALLEANQYLLAAEVEGEEARDVIMALGDAIAATGGGSNELSRMAQNLQQIKNLGKASSVDIKQFANAGINVYGMLSDYTGKSVKKLQEMDISYELLTNALKSASSEGGRYFGAMEKQSETINGSIASLKDSISQLLGELTADLLPVIKDILSYVNDLIKRIKEMSPEQQAMIQRIALIVAALGPAVTILGKLITLFGGLSTGIATFLKSEKVVAFFSKVASSGGGLSGVLKTIVGTLGGVGTAVAVVVAALTALYFSNEDVRNAINNLASSLGGVLASAFKLVQGIVEALSNAFGWLLDKATELWNKIKETEAWNTFITFIETAIGWIDTLVQKFEGLIGWVQKGVDWFNNLFNASSSAGDSINKIGRNGNGFIMSGGYGTQSGGFMSGGTINITNTFNVQNASEVSQAVLNGWADRMTDRINENLGRQYA